MVSPAGEVPGPKVQGKVGQHGPHEDFVLFAVGDVLDGSVQDIPLVARIKFTTIPFCYPADAAVLAHEAELLLAHVARLE